MVVKLDTKTIGNRTICLQNLVLGPDLYDVITQCCSTDLFFNKCIQWKMSVSEQLLNILCPHAPAHALLSADHLSCALLIEFPFVF